MNDVTDQTKDIPGDPRAGLEPELPRASSDPTALPETDAGPTGDELAAEAVEFERSVENDDLADELDADLGDDLSDGSDDEEDLASDDEEDLASDDEEDLASDDEEDPASDDADVPAVDVGSDIVWDNRVSGNVGPEVIVAAVKTLPNAPGVYRMMNADGDVLYVGKAKSLKKRVANYTRTGLLNNRIARMVRSTAAMDFVRTRTETEALLLEANLIKRLRPRFNVLLRDDKSFPYILIADDHEAPVILKHRGARKRKGSYFGPFASAGAVATTITALQKAFLIRTCSDSVYESRTRPCLLHQIKRCSGPCTREVALEDYAGYVREAEEFLSGSSRKVREDLARTMEAASHDLDFERAAIYRDRLSALSHIQSHQGINPQTVEEADVFAIHQDGGLSCVQVFFFRTGQNWGNRSYFPKADKSEEADGVLGAFLAQFYDDKPVPKLILISHDFEDRELLERALCEHAGHRVQLSVPQRGEKKELVDHALTNAREALGRKLAETSSQARLLTGIGEVFGLPATPRRVEVYDNSHVMGTNAVGGMIVAGPEGFSKTHYRKFNIRSEDITPGDDYGMMREVMKRRFSRLLKENGPRPTQGPEQVKDREAEGLGPWPDLVVIDGGKGQLSAVMEIMKELELTDLPVVSIAKGRDREAGRETFFMPGRSPFMLPPRDPVLYFIQRLRDEAHRFAIGSHRARRKKEMGRNPLDEIPGIGPSRKKALLRHFGTAKAVSRAGLDDLVTVEGISRAMAEAIYDHFHESA
ncbi:Excinuclease ABC subunit C [Faunimonas pinastri]|uniref:UvrABC system protein C n=1 Tax=Faunimonas pinastri TaxID=1855383 RepID=A0A1H9ATI6_9HYPH|nr:excinuclease ABC subunit UvrC [Faunimonas pinastri]SEP80142.1 Excinuclease ABC subunit C [Faunimonas pinastri]